MKDSARVVGGGDGIEMCTDGPCLTATLANLAAGSNGKPISDTSVSKIRADALGLLDEILQAYSEDVAQGEVGLGGTARASIEPAKSGQCPTGLLYGRVQSGKTMAVITA